MHLHVNGQLRETGAATVLALVESLGLDMRYAAIEKNGAIVSKNSWSSTPLAEGDRLELLTFIGGG